MTTAYLLRPVHGLAKCSISRNTLSHIHHRRIATTGKLDLNTLFS
jgi:hypothetical protein